MTNDGTASPPVAMPPRRRRHRLVKWSLVVAAFIVLYFGFTFAQVVLTAHRDDAPNSGAAHTQAIIVLGAAQYNGRPSPVLKARLDQALKLYRWGLAPVLVTTGGRQPGDKFTEATTGYDYFRARGVPDAAIRKEVNGGTTWESLQAAARFLRAEGITHVILVSDGYHSKRLLEIAGEVHLSARVSPASERLATSLRFRYYVRESVAVSLGRIIGFHALDHR